MLQGSGHIKKTVALIFSHIQCLHLMYSETAWVLVFSGIQVHPQIILDPDNLPDYPMTFPITMVISSLHIKFNKAFCFRQSLQMHVISFLMGIKNVSFTRKVYIIKLNVLFMIFSFIFQNMQYFN